MCNDRTTTDSPTQAIPLRSGQLSDVGGVCATEATQGVGGETDDFSQRFVREMYGDIWHNHQRRKHVLGGRFRENLVVQISERLKLYADSGNRGYLVDAAKFAMWQWIKDRAQETANAAEVASGT